MKGQTVNDGFRLDLIQGSRVPISLEGKHQGVLTVNGEGKRLIFVVEEIPGRMYCIPLVEQSDPKALPEELRNALVQFVRDRSVSANLACDRLYSVVRRMLDPELLTRAQLLVRLRADMTDAMEGRSATREQSREAAIWTLDQLIEQEGLVKNNPMPESAGTKAERQANLPKPGNWMRK